MRFRYRFLLLFVFIFALSQALQWIFPFEERQIDSSAIQGRWTAQEVDGQTVVVEGASAGIPWVMLNDGQMSGSFGCAHFDAKYSVEGGNLFVSDLVEEDQSCDADSASSEIAFAERRLRDMVAGNDLAASTEDGYMVWVADGHEVIFVR